MPRLRPQCRKATRERRNAELQEPLRGSRKVFTSENMIFPCSDSGRGSVPAWTILVDKQRKQSSQAELCRHLRHVSDCCDSSWGRNEVTAKPPGQLLSEEGCAQRPSPRTAPHTAPKNPQTHNTRGTTLQGPSPHWKTEQ